jgi:hypothetical protein
MQTLSLATGSGMNSAQTAVLHKPKKALGNFNLVTQNDENGVLLFRIFPGRASRCLLPDNQALKLGRVETRGSEK